MILGFLFFIRTFLKHCKALSTEKYRHYTNIYFVVVVVVVVVVIIIIIIIIIIIM